MSEPTSLAAFAKIFGKFLPSIIGSFLAVLTLQYDNTKPLSSRILSGIIAFITGVAVSHYVGSAIISVYPEISEIVADSIKFALGIFGLTLINNLINEIKPWMESLRKKVFGEKND